MVRPTTDDGQPTTKQIMENEFNRAERLMALRPQIPVIIEESAVSVAERFQNTTLRQICKLQHELLEQVFRSYIVKRKSAYFKLGDQKRLDYIKHAVDKDLRFRGLMVGLIAGHFTLEEWEIYLSDENEHRKRLTNLVVQRLQSIYFV